MTLIKFKDLEFKPHKCIDNAVSCFIRFTDDDYISIVGGGDKSLLSGHCSEEDDDNVNEEEVNEHLKQVQLNTLMKLTYKN